MASIIFDGSYNKGESAWGSKEYYNNPNNFVIQDGGSGGAPAARITGEKLGRYQILSSDGAGPNQPKGQRSEHTIGSAANPNQKDGDVFYFGYSIYIPSNYPCAPAVNGSTGGSGCSIAFQLHTIAPISPKVALNVRHGIQDLSYSYAVPTTDGGWKLANGTAGHPPVGFGGWNDYVIWVSCSQSSSTGFCEVWHRAPTEAALTKKLPKRAMVTSDGGLYTKVGIYTGNLTETKTRTVWYSNFKIAVGDSRTDATFRQAAFDLVAPGGVVTGGGGTVAPVAAFTINPASPQIGQAITLDAGASTGVGLTYSWNVT